MRSLESLRAKAAVKDAERRRKQELEETAQNLRWSQEAARSRYAARQVEKREQASQLLDLSHFEDLANQFRVAYSSAYELPVEVNKDRIDGIFIKPRRKWTEIFENGPPIRNEKTGYKHSYQPDDSQAFISVAWKEPQLKLLEKAVGVIIECDSDGRIFLRGNDRVRLSYDDWDGNLSGQEEAFDYIINHPRPLIKVNYPPPEGHSLDWVS